MPEQPDPKQAEESSYERGQRRARELAAREAPRIVITPEVKR